MIRASVIRARVAAVTAVTALALTGCAGESESDSSALSLMSKDAEGTFRTAVANTEKVKSVEFAIEGNDEAATFTGKGAIAFGPPLSAEFTMEGEGQKVLTRILDTAIYIQVPPEQQAQMGGKRWMKMDMVELGKATGQNFGQTMRQLQDINPGVQLKALLDSGELTVVGEETIDGVKTVHYTGDMDPSGYLSRFDAASRAQVQKELQQAGVKEVKTDLWLDEDRRLRRCLVVMGSTKMQADYTDYDKPVKITAPPAGETADFGKLLDQLKQLGETAGG